MAKAPEPALPPDGTFAIDPPIEPMLAKSTESLPQGEGFLFEPKWDGFRALVFRRRSQVYIQSRDLRPLDRYFPELHALFAERLPDECVLDGEIVIATEHGLDFELLQLRLHPAASRVAKLAAETPAAFVAFDVLALDGEDLRTSPQSERRAAARDARSARYKPPLHLTPVTRDRALAEQWLQQFEGAGLDGVMAKPERGVYEPGKRSMIKIKHARTAECVVAGFRWHKNGKGTLIGSLLLGLYDDEGGLHHVGVTSSFTMQRRAELVAELEPLRANALEQHPWREWAVQDGSDNQRMPGGQSRWSAGKDLSWEPLRLERVCEVKYDHLQGDRFRHAAMFLRWRDGQTAPSLPLRSARGHDPFRAREGLFFSYIAGSWGCVSTPGSKSGSSASCCGRNASSTCIKLMRMRVQVVKRPRIESTSTSAACSCAAAPGWRSFQRSNPASASSRLRARPISISGCLGLRRPPPSAAGPLRARDGCTRAGSPACFW